MIKNAFRLIFALFFFAIALLAIFKAPTNKLWLLSIVLTEYGHLLFWLPLLALLPGWRKKRLGQAAAIIACFAAFLLLTPLMRSLSVAMSLKDDLEKAFVENSASEASGIELGRSRPISVVDLFAFVDLPQISWRTIPFDTVGGRTLTLDLYQPKNQSSPAPCVIVIHGGAWRSGDSRQLPELNRYLAGLGCVAASISYRLAPESRFPAQIDDVKSAFLHLKSNAGELGIDSTKFVFLGRSAGAHLAMLAGYTFDDPAIRGAISFYGPADMHYGYAHPANPAVINTQKVLENFLGGGPEEVYDVYDAASPIKHVNRATRPTLLLHGGRDELVSFRQSERLAKVLAAYEIPYFYLQLPWATHGFDFMLSGPGGQLSTFAIERFLLFAFNARNQN